MTREELQAAIEKNRARLQDTRAEQLRARDFAALELEDVPLAEQPTDDELAVHRYEPISAVEVQEIRGPEAE